MILNILCSNKLWVKDKYLDWSELQELVFVIFCSSIVRILSLETKLKRCSISLYSNHFELFYCTMELIKIHKLTVCMSILHVWVISLCFITHVPKEWCKDSLGIGQPQFTSSNIRIQIQRVKESFIAEKFPEVNQNIQQT